MSLLTASSALSAGIVGIVSDSNGNPVNGVTISVTDASGKQTGQATSDLYGRYCLGPLKPGNYIIKLDPGKTGFMAGNGVVDLGEEGLTVNWTATVQAAAVAMWNLGVASAATATCAGAWWSTAALAAGGAAGAGGVTAGVLMPGEEGGIGGPKHVTPPITGTK